mgnify:FL=1
MRIFHTPVLLKEAVDALNVQPGGVYIDGTLGEGGHAEAILQASDPRPHLLGIELDPQALTTARKRLQPYWPVCTLVRGNYAHIGHLARVFGFSQADGILLDLGLSSLQLEGESRGFSFLRDDPLDMRFDPEQPLTADEVVNRYPEPELERILREYGEEHKAHAIARAIVDGRPIHTSRELATLVESVLGRPPGIHPATRTFQAIRIEVNGEVRNLKECLRQSLHILRPNGRLAVISYHSLEDRTVKEFMRREASGRESPDKAPTGTSSRGPTLRLVSKKVVTPSEEEIRRNPRSRSAKLRVAERI